MIDATPTANPKIWVLYISHKEGEEICVYSNENAALVHLTEWAKEWWGHEDMPCPITDLKSDVEIRAMYWGKMKDNGVEF